MNAKTKNEKWRSRGAENHITGSSDGIITNCSLLLELHDACQRQLFQEVNLFCSQMSCSNDSSSADSSRSIGKNCEPEGGKVQQTRNQTQNKRPRVTSNHIDEHDQEQLPRNQNRRTWAEIVQSLSRYTAFMSNNEHNQACKLISICLLKYLAPHMNMTQHNRNRRDDKYDELSLTKYTLEEIMRKIRQLHGNSPMQYNPFVIQNEKLAMSLWNFLYNGLRPFLSSRQILPRSTNILKDKNNNESAPIVHGSEDLLHVLSMAIAPEIHVDMVESGNSDIFSQRTKYFISLRQPLYFEITYSQRADIVHVLSQCLVLGEISDSQLLQQDYQHEQKQQQQSDLQQSAESYNDCVTGGIAHLRASLQSFCLSALSNHHIIDAKRTLSNISIDTTTFVLDELKILVQTLVEDVHQNEKYQGENCRRNVKRAKTKMKKQFIQQRFYDPCNDIAIPSPSSVSAMIYHQQKIRCHELDKPLCVHCAIGDILRDLILRYNGARHYADIAFTSQALAELTAAVATMLGLVQKSSPNAEPNNISRLPTSCVIASLIDASTALFHFLISPSSLNLELTVENEGDREEHNCLDEGQLLEIGMKDALIQCSIQLLYSPNYCIVSSVSSFLAIGFAYSDRNRLQHLIAQVFQSLEKQITKSWDIFPCYDIIAILSRISVSFASSITASLIGTLDATHNKQTCKDQTKVGALKLIALVAQSQPKAVCKYIDILIKVSKTTNFDEQSYSQLCAIFCSCRCYLLLLHGICSSIHRRQTDEVIQSISSGWLLFKLMKHAFCTTNFDIAQDILGKQLLRTMSSSSKSYLWYTILSKIAQAELALSEGGSTYIPGALSSLDSAINILQSLAALASCSIMFQYELLCQRKDFLSLCLSLRGMCAEMKLTNLEGDHHTRTRKHQSNLADCFFLLASNYAKLNKKYGAIQCRQTRASIRTMYSVCRFMGSAIQQIFCEASKSPHSKFCSDQMGQVLKGNTGNILYKLMSKLNKELIERIADSTPKFRAEAMSEIIEVLFKFPMPFPRGFFSFKSLPKIQIEINASDERSNQSESSDVEVQVGSPFVLVASGILPEQFFKKSHISFSQIVAYRSFTYDGPVMRDGDNEDTSNNATIDESCQELSVPNDAIERDEEFPSELLPAYNHIDVKGMPVMGSKFSIPVSCEPLLQEGYYYLEVSLFVRDLCGEEYLIPIDDDYEGIMILCK